MPVQIDPTKIFELLPAEIKVNPNLPRRRQDLGEIEKMANSILTFGQLQPIVINQDNEIIYGGRRLAACTLLGIKVKACYREALDPITMRELELEENIQRKNFTPAEECAAISELVELKQAKYGKPTQGREGGFTLTDAGEAIGKTKGSVIEALQIAEMIKEFPNLAEAKTKSEIKKAYKGLQRVQESVLALSKFEERAKESTQFELVNRDALEHLTVVKRNSIDLLITDPPYGISIDKVGMTVGGKTGGDLSTSSIKYEDTEEYALKLLEHLAYESFHFTKETAHAFVFIAPSHFEKVKNMFNSNGWFCSERPIIWIKGETGQCNQPDKWFSSAYEMILFARKPASKLVLQRGDWIQCDIVSSTNKIHQAEKPVPLIKELIQRVALPGAKLYDPFMGSGAIIQAGCELNMFVLGCEKSIESYALAMSRMDKWRKNK